MPKQRLSAHSPLYAIHRFDSDADLPSDVLKQDNVFIAKTPKELSIVVPQKCKLESSEVSENWRMLEVLGPLDFSLVGIIADISAVLASAKISLFVVSTFDTDYILVKDDSFEQACAELTNADYSITNNTD